MTIKAIAFSAQQRVAERCGVSLQRSHVYESLAAAFGFASYASLCADAAFDIGPPGRLVAPRMTDSVARRLAELGFPDLLNRQVALELTAVVSDHGLRTVHIDRVIDSLVPGIYTQTALDEIEHETGERYDDAPANDDHLTEDWEASSFLGSGLEEAAKRGNPKAHYALALLLRTDEAPVGSSYWHDRQMQGDQLSDVQLEWASAHRDTAEREATRLRHLCEAARLGHPDACVDAAAEFEDPAFLKTIGQATVRDPARASEVAAELGQLDQAGTWCAIAAQEGDIEAVRHMIDLFDRDDLLRRWTWVYFARLLGTDLTEDDYQLVNEDGSDYDDEVGGPGFPVGVEGVHLPVLDKQQEARALSEAHAMVHRLKNGLGVSTP